MRGDLHFEFDVYGRIRRVWHPHFLDIEYGYDENSRLIWRRVNDQYLQRFFYGNPKFPHLITHFLNKYSLLAYGFYHLFVSIS